MSNALISQQLLTATHKIIELLCYHTEHINCREAPVLDKIPRTLET